METWNLPECRKMEGVGVNTRAAFNESPSVGEPRAVRFQSLKRMEITVQPLDAVYRFLSGPHATGTLMRGEDAQQIQLCYNLQSILGGLTRNYI